MIQKKMNIKFIEYKATSFFWGCFFISVEVVLKTENSLGELWMKVRRE